MPKEKKLLFRSPRVLAMCGDFVKGLARILSVTLAAVVNLFNFLS